MLTQANSFDAVTSLGGERRAVDFVYVFCDGLPLHPQREVEKVCVR